MGVIRHYWALQGEVVVVTTLLLTKSVFSSSL